MENNNEMTTMENLNDVDTVVMDNPVIKEHATTGKMILVSAAVYVAGTGIKYLVKRAIKKIRKQKDVVYEVDGQEVEIVDEEE